MLNLKQDVIRQLNKLYGISFKYKYKTEIKERILFFIDKKYNKLSLLELIKIKNEIVLVENEIKEIKKDFFNKYKEEIFNSFNPIWYENKEKYIPIYHEKEFYKAIILKECIEQVEQEIVKNFNRNLIKMSGKIYNYSIRCQFQTFIERNTENSYVFKERKTELNQLKKEITDHMELYKGNARIEKIEELNRQVIMLEELNINQIIDKLNKIEEQEEDFFLKKINDGYSNKSSEYTNDAFEYLFCYLILKEINKRLNKYN